MAFDFGVWRVDGEFQQMVFKGMDFENRLEDILEAHLEILRSDWMVIGRQIDTGLHGRLDLLAVDASGNLVIIELKRDMTPRDAVAQVLDYGAWARDLKNEDIAQIFDEYKGNSEKNSIDFAFEKKFGLKIPDELNQSHQLVLVATQLDPQSERIIDYLSDEYGVAINVLFFRIFEDSGRQYLSRVWLIDSYEQQASSLKSAPLNDWNGEFYSSFGYSKDVVEDGLERGYIAAGGGTWYWKTLLLLSPGDRVWVNVPGKGYIGCAEVVTKAIVVDDFRINDGTENGRPISEVSEPARSLQHENEYGSEKADYLVEVKWLYRVNTLEGAIREKGFFGNQNSVAKPRATSWDHTVKRLKLKFGITDQIPADNSN